MAYPTGMLSFVLEEMDSRILAIRKSCTAVRDTSAAGPLQSGQIISLFQYLRVERARLLQAAQTPGLADYAKEQKATPGLDLVAEWTNLRDKIDAVTQWTSANFPTDPGTGALLERTLSADGPVERTFTTAQLAAYRTQLDGLIAAIA